MDKTLVDRALTYHRAGRPGKIAVVPSKPMANRDDLSLISNERERTWHA